MPKITHLKINDSDIFIDSLDTKNFLYHKKDKKQL